MTPSYTVRDGRVRPVYIYSIDISEFAVNKLRDRGTLSVTPIVTNAQDFLVHLKSYTGFLFFTRNGTLQACINYDTMFMELLKFYGIEVKGKKVAV